MRTIKALIFGLFALTGALAGGSTFGQAANPLAPSLAPPAVAAAPTATAAPVATPAATQPLTKADADAWLDGYLPFALNRSDIAGAVVTIVKDGKILTARGYGYADVAKRTKVDPDRTLFRPGSVSKLVTWTAVMQLVEQRKLDLDRDVNAYLDFKIPPRDGKPVTLRQLMTHTAGFEEAARKLIVYDPKDLVPLGDYLKAWVPTRIFAPGTTPAYSNWATTLAGYIVQRASGLSFDDYVDQRIFAPLGMRTATFRQPLPERLRPSMATGYTQASVPGMAFELVTPAPAGSLTASGTDMARFMLAHLNKGELDGKRIFSAATAETMHNSPLTMLPPLNRMELGFFETNINGREVIAHLGDTQAFHTSLHLFVQDGVGFYVSFNSGGKEGAAHVLRGAMFQDFADRYFPSTARDGRVDAKLAAEHARMMTGFWSNSRRSETNFLSIAQLIGQVEVSTGADGELVIGEMTGLNGLPRKWVEIAPFVWRDRDSHERLAAKVVDGQIVRWSVDQLSPFMVFDRVPASRSAGWLLPALYASLGVLVLTFLFWPVAAFTRWRFGKSLPLTGGARRTYRATRIAAGLVLAVLAGWAALVSILFEDLSAASAFEPWLWVLQIGGLLVFTGAVFVAAWNVRLTWRDGRSWWRRIWSVLILLAALVVLYVAFSFGLLAMTVYY